MSRTPDFRVTVMNKVTDEKNNNIGAAWHNEDGSISIVLNPFVHLIGSKDLLITLFPPKEK